VYAHTHTCTHAHRHTCTHAHTHVSGLLPHLKQAGHRVLIFSQWTTMLDIIEEFVTNLGLRYLRLDGSTAVKERQELLDEYNADTDITCFLLSTRAGGMGINLTSADTVVLHGVSH
jgi:SWI/SNF-related matrix-associated actin-dependent regulator of chromatin subfamily A containing DEAD/H box 1